LKPLKTVNAGFIIKSKIKAVALIREGQQCGDFSQKVGLVFGDGGWD
jgi:hypothetical protein